MAEALKHVYSPAYVARLNEALHAQHPHYNKRDFLAFVFDKQWPERPLKARLKHLAHALKWALDSTPYETALEHLKPVASQFGGGEQGDYASMFFPHFVEQYGLEHFDASIAALAHFTLYSSAEFAVRPFIVRYGDRMMAQMQAWAESDHYMLRRLASEGCRPRLPWAMALPQFKRDPALILPILDTLKADTSLFVRRSVANNLNDIAKDHPETVATLAAKWQGQHPNTDWLIKHACRSLLKAGQPQVLALFGFMPPDHIQLTDLQADSRVAVGGTFNFGFTLHISPQQQGRLRLEYAIDFMKANGQHSRKVFQISESEVVAGSKRVGKKHSFKPVSTRRYYAGEHGLAVIVNGCERCYLRFGVGD